MSNNSRNNPDSMPSRQDNEALELLRRLLIVQSATSGTQLPRSPILNIPNLQLLLALSGQPLSQASENSSHIARSFHSAIGSVPLAVQNLQTHELLDTLLRQTSPLLQAAQQFPQASNAPGLGHTPASAVNAAIDNGLAPKNQQTQHQQLPSLDLGTQQLALLVRQLQQVAAAYTQAATAVSPAASTMLGSQAELTVALNALAAFQASRGSAPAAPLSLAAPPGRGAVLPLTSPLQLSLQVLNPVEAQGTFIDGISKQASASASSQPPAISGTVQDSAGKRTQPLATMRAEAFPLKLYRLVTEAEGSGKEDVVSFTREGSAFRIHHPQRFAREILPLYFRHQRFDSFKRQLSMYGFNRISVGPDEGAFEHRLFKKGQPDLVQQMRRVSVERQQLRQQDEQGNRSVIGSEQRPTACISAASKPPPKPPPSVD